ncbi:MAG: Ppx/GppA phosphatase family protein [Bacillota bacterium]
MNKKRAAAIDFGSNSSRLLIAEYDTGRINVIYQDLITTRLAKSIEDNKLLNLDSINKTIEAAKEFNNKMKNYRVEKYRSAGTSALRDANNSADFIKLLKDETGIDLDIISGNKEAKLTYSGATSDTDNSENIVIDIGGGSTEFIKMEEGITQEVSFDMGAVRFTERFIADPALKISEADQERIITEATNYLQEKLQSNTKKDFIGVGGTITTLAAIDKKITNFDPKKIEGYILERASINNIINDLSNMAINERKKVNGLQKERADIIITGSLILEAILEYFSVDAIKVSNKDLLYGLIIEIFEDDQYYLLN